MISRRSSASIGTRSGSSRREVSISDAARGRDGRRFGSSRLCVSSGRARSLHVPTAWLSEQPTHPSPEPGPKATLTRDGSACFDGSTISLSSPNRLGSIELAMPLDLPAGDEVVRVARQPRRCDRRVQRHFPIEDHAVSRGREFRDHLASAAAGAQVSGGGVAGRDVEDAGLHRRRERLHELSDVVLGAAHSSASFRISLRYSLKTTSVVGVCVA